MALAWQKLTKVDEHDKAAIVHHAGEQAFGAVVWGAALTEVVRNA